MDAQSHSTIAAAIDIPLMVAHLAEFEPAVVYLFGSAATGRLVAASDVDIGFLPHHPCDPVAVFDAAQRLAGDLGRDVDLVDLSRASVVFRAQVLTTGIAVHVADVRKRDDFEMYVLSDYARTNEERCEVLEAYRGSRHAG
jgi:predicted nucleotidyltransferase